MSKILVHGDVHGRSKWKSVDDSTYDKVVFMGDYFDSFDISANDQIINMQEILAYKQANPEKVILLWGNHDLSYLMCTQDFICSGFQKAYSLQISNLLYDYRHLFTMAVEIDDYLFTHAGVSSVWLNKYNEHVKHEPIASQINLIWHNKPNAFGFYTNQGRAFSRTGDEVTQSPIWIRPDSLVRSSAHPKQIVGHTQQPCPTTQWCKGHTIIIVDLPDYYTTITKGKINYNLYEE